MPTGLECISQERRDAFEGGLDSEDDKYVHGELAYAAAAYILRGRSFGQDIPMYWPWTADKWNPTPNDHRIELAKAGALIAAEIDRLNRREDELNANENVAGLRIRGKDSVPEPGPSKGSGLLEQP